MSTDGPSIYIVGAQSTGKSTLAEALQDYFKTLSRTQPSDMKLAPPGCITEVARTTMARHGLKTEQIFSSPVQIMHLQRLILLAQHEAEAACPERWFISDRSGVDPMVYARVLGKDSGGTEEMEKSEQGKRLIQRMCRSLVLVCEPNPSWLVDDGTRYMPTSVECWIDLHREFCAVLQRLGVPFKVVRADQPGLSQRVSLVTNWWWELRDQG